MTPLLPTTLGEPRNDSPLPFAVPDDLLVPALMWLQAATRVEAIFGVGPIAAVVFALLLRRAESGPGAHGLETITTRTT